MMKKITPLMTKNPERESVEAEGSEHSDSLGNSKEGSYYIFTEDVIAYQLPDYKRRYIRVYLEI